MPKMIRLNVVWLFVLLLARGVFSGDSFTGVSDSEANAIRTQRELSKSIPIDQVSTLGISVNQLLFAQEGYTNDAVNSLNVVLDLGVGTLMVDIYWNEFTQRWQLCPAPFPSNTTSDLGAIVDLSWNDRKFSCQANTTIGSIFSVLYTYLHSTNINADATMINVLLNLKDIRYPEATKGTNLTSSTGSQSATISQYVEGINSTFLSSQETSLAQIVNKIDTSLFTPSQLANYRMATLSTKSDSFYNQSSELYPTLDDYLFSEYNRVNTFVSSDEMRRNATYSYNFTAIDNATLFMQQPNSSIDLVTISDTKEVNKCLSMLDNQNSYNISLFNYYALNLHFRYIIDSDDIAFTNHSSREYVDCGYSVILNSTTLPYAGNLSSDLTSNTTTHYDALWRSINIMLPNSLWAFAWGQPSSPDVSSSSNSTTSEDDNRDGSGVSNRKNSTTSDNDDGSNDAGTNQVAFSCGALGKNGIFIDNCYLRLPYACQNSTNPHDWIVDFDDKKNYFESYLDVACPTGYFFSIPKLNLEMLSLFTYMNKTTTNSTYSVWVDLNDITVSQCYVTGGPYASCPYQRTITYLALVRMTAPSAIVAVVILVLIFLEKFIRVNPIHLNRKKYWKKAIEKYTNEQAYEGVPS